MKTRFQEAKAKLRFRREEALVLLREADLSKDFEEQILHRVKDDGAMLTLALTGEYTTGKSSIIEALTGAEIKIGAGVTTAQVTFHSYEDLRLVDMPGTLSGQMEHDSIARQAIADADLLLFVVSNELFNEASLPYFRMAAETLNKKHQMLLVVNKFDRFNLAGRTPSQAVKFIAGQLAEQIKPLNIAAFGPVVISAREYLESREVGSEEKRRRKTDESRFETFIRAVDEFTVKRGDVARLARPLQQLIDVLEQALTTFGANDDGGDIEAILRRRVFTLTEIKTFARSELRSLREGARTKIMEPAEKLLKLIDEKVLPAEMEAKVEAVEKEIEGIVKRTGDDLRRVCEKLEKDIQVRLDAIDASPMANKARAGIDFKFNRPTMAGLGLGDDKLLRTAAEYLKKGSDYLAKNSKEVTNALSNVYKFFGGKFKPWGKVKLGRAVEGTGKILGPLAVLGEAYGNYREEERKEAAERKIRTLRAELRAQFMDIAQQFADSLREEEDEIVLALFDKPIGETQKVVQDIADARKGKEHVQSRMTRLVTAIRRDLDLLSRG